MDRLAKEKRSWNMSKIRSENTRPEVIVRSILHKMGYRFRLHVKNIVGKPDIVLPRFKTTIFVHGCFWHSHHECKYAYTPKTRPDFWQKKFEDNIKRHHIVEQQLTEQGWNVIVVWECELKDPKRLKDRLKSLILRR
jgi:DNA mismatch endonuclease (patch repair protein)